MSANNEIVTVANRTDKELEALWDGQRHTLPPYPARVSLPRIVAMAGRFQNPVMGRGTPYEDWSSKAEYLVGIVEDNDPIDFIEQTKAPQRWDSQIMSGAYEVIPARGHAYEIRQAQTPQVAGEGFVKA